MCHPTLIVSSMRKNVADMEFSGSTPALGIIQIRLDLHVEMSVS